MENPLISVIVPVYKAEHYLNECISSIVNQTYSNLEIILIDDGSPDRCPEICDSWAQQDLRIQVIHKPNGGQSSARNVALDVAKGMYISFVDSDDYIVPHMYEQLLHCIIQTNAKIASGLFANDPAMLAMSFDKCNTNIKVMNSQQTIDSLLYGEITDSLCDKLFDRSVWQELRFPEGETNEEYPLFIPMLLSAGSICFVDCPVYYYRRNEESTTASTWKGDADIVLKHLKEMQHQLEYYGLGEKRQSFRFFQGVKSFWIALQLAKNYTQINSVAKQNYYVYLSNVQKRFFVVMFSGHFSLKNKILYAMVATRTLRPIYALLGKK